ncbi:MAG: hypothetical protein IJB29_02455, partial [Mailhella sp.]|nr:hypothetical protein [Mailhella sp.]
HWNNTPFPPDSIPPGAMLFFGLWDTPQGKAVQASFLCQTPAAFFSTDENVMKNAALRHEPLLLSGADIETPAGPGLRLKDFTDLVGSMTKKHP